MTARLLPSRLLVVTDRHLACAPLPRLVPDLFDAGLRWLWLRDRDLPPGDRRVLAEALAGAARRHGGAALTIGDDVELAAEVRATGVHLRSPAAVVRARRRLGAASLIGVSAHDLAEVRAARQAGADYATLSPVFASSSKPGYGPALGLPGLAEAARLGLPVLALAGVTAAGARDCLDAGAAGVAVMGEIMRGGVSGLGAYLDRLEPT